MPRTTNADDLPETGDRLAGLADRTSLMAIDATLRALGSPAGAASTAGVADIARRMMQATKDFRAAMQDTAE
ncbi:hypothetical protein J2848_005564 [Azospirillum lipoferum]|uniref:Uncharacterized protein n=1 Tax=Azospirillum lipoferum TaxID=193 RepID=A0A5A9GUL3_AZOLI|nr:MULTISPECIES: hypothetical protein [Azospirillum]KAA0598023.1 hypothetical protein FZ942_02695 [Azospirillum lipoferum]MCP1613867.1 hypothetical protein [Azospirillum lipoferum]MDW5534680.1 hypothetical protein [Azospirillum sp. NL1]